MRCLRTLRMTCLIWLWSSLAVCADCDRLLSVIELAQATFTTAAAPDQSRLPKINKMIRDINNDAMLAVLRQSGQAHAYGTLRHFLTVMMFVADQPDGVVQLPDAFADDLAQAAETIDKACASQKPQGTAAAAKVDPSEPRRLAGERHWRALTGWVGDVNAEIERHRYQLRLLGIVLLGFVLTVLLAMAAHVAVMVLRIILRGRSICDIPIHMTVLGDRLAGRITVIGKLGCVIIPDVPPDAEAAPVINRGIYLNIVVGEQVLNAKTMVETTDVYRMLFSTPLSRKTLRQLLLSSHSPVRYDLSALQGYKLGRRYFGIGSLPKA